MKSFVFVLATLSFASFFSPEARADWKPVFSCTGSVVVDRNDYQAYPGDWRVSRQLVIRDQSVVNYFVSQGALPQGINLNNKRELVLGVDSMGSNGIRFQTTVMSGALMYLIRQIGTSDYQLEAFRVLPGMQRQMLATWVFHNCWLTQNY